MGCVICSSDVGEFLEVYDDRYGYPGLFRLGKCAGCGHISLLAHFEPAELGVLYTDYYPRSSFDLEDYRPAPAARGFRSWLNGERRLAYTWVPEKVRVLDIGCGFGETLAYHKSRGCDVYGVEADENIRRVAERYGFNVHVGLFDPDRYEPGFFDYVTMDQVIEHVTDPLATLRGIAKVLKPGGVAVVSTPNASGWGAKLFGRRWINWHAPYHLQHFSRKSMGLAAAQAGLELEEAKTITSSEWLFYQWLHLATYPEMGKPSAFWSPRAQKSWKDKLFIYALHAAHLTKIDHMLTRFFDARGVGDNYLFFLRKK